jgi:hypothetical protein
MTAEGSRKPQYPLTRELLDAEALLARFPQRHVPYDPA